jgi:hypothetical protein
MRGGALVGLALATGCAFAAPPSAPPFAGAPPGPPGELGGVAAAPAAPAAPREEVGNGNGSGSGPEQQAAPRPSVSIEAPFRLDKRIFPATKEAFLADLRDRTRWNTGGMGTLVAPIPPVPGHPLPKVIIDVLRVNGPHPQAELQRVLRKMFWIKVVGCYGLGAYKDQKLRGAASLVFGVSAAGKASGARLTGTTLADAEVATCLAEQVRSVDLPRAKGRSVVGVEIQVGPGDEPLPPPASLVVPGEGELAPEAIRAVIEAALPAFEACYRPALAYAPELWGRLGVRFHVTEKGKTDEAFEVESRFPDERVALCVLRAARGLRFPKPAGGDLRFIVPLRFWSDRSPVAERS